MTILLLRAARALRVGRISVSAIRQQSSLQLCRMAAMPYPAYMIPHSGIDPVGRISASAIRQ